MTCLHCGVLFQPRRSWQRFCAEACRWAHHTRAKPREGQFEDLRWISEILRDAGYPDAAGFLEMRLRGDPAPQGQASPNPTTRQGG